MHCGPASVVRRVWLAGRQAPDRRRVLFAQQLEGRVVDGTESHVGRPRGVAKLRVSIREDPLDVALGPARVEQDQMREPSAVDRPDRRRGIDVRIEVPVQPGADLGDRVHVEGDCVGSDAAHQGPIDPKRVMDHGMQCVAPHAVDRL